MKERLGETLGEWFVSHPRALRGCTIGLIVISGWQFYRSVKLDRLAVELIGNIQKARSEALGG